MVTTILFSHREVKLCKVVKPKIALKCSQTAAFKVSGHKEIQSEALTALPVEGSLHQVKTFSSNKNRRKQKKQNNYIH